MDSGRHARPIVQMEVTKILGVFSEQHTRYIVQKEVVRVLSVDSGRYARRSVPMDLLHADHNTFSFLHSDGSNKLTLHALWTPRQTYRSNGSCKGTLHE